MAAGWRSCIIVENSIRVSLSGAFVENVAETVMQYPVIITIGDVIWNGVLCVVNS